MRPVRGFTLIEVMIALAIFTAVLGLLMMGYGQGLSMWDKRLKYGSYWAGVEIKYRLLSSLFDRVQVADYIERNGAFTPYFIGANQSVEFLSKAPILDFPGRVQPIFLQFEKKAGLYDLVYSQAGRYSDPARGLSWEDGDKVVVIQGLQQGYIEYLAPAFPLPEGVTTNELGVEEKKRYREVAEWLPEFNSQIMWRVPEKIKFVFVDDKNNVNSWTFTLSTGSDAWSLEIYTNN